MYHALIAAYLAAGGVVTMCRPGHARSRLVWGVTSHPTRSLPLSLGVVGRW
jgi:hypothetical protein